MDSKIATHVGELQLNDHTPHGRPTSSVQNLKFAAILRQVRFDDEF